MGLLSGMEMVGLDEFKNADVMSVSGKETKTAKNQSEEKKEIVINEEDILFDKHYKCPVCDVTFTSRCVRAGKVRFMEHDTDLRPLYDKVDILKYDVITCENCGYSALPRYYGKLTVKQAKNIKTAVGDKFRGIDNKKKFYSYDDAVMRYKLALLTAMIKNSKSGERGYICLKMAWIYRGQRESMKENDAVSASLYDAEMECIANAYDGLMTALSSEPLPIAGMDEYTLKYVIADLARKLEKYDDAVKLVSQILLSKSANSRLKKKALELKECLKKEIKK